MIKLDHVALIVSDMEATLDFYVNFLGLTVKREFELSAVESKALFNVASPAKSVQLLMDEGMLELFAFERGIRIPEEPGRLIPGLFHFAVQVGRPMDAFIAEAKRRGTPVSSIVRGGKTIYFIKDPDGVFIEVKA